MGSKVFTNANRSMMISCIMLFILVYAEGCESPHLSTGSVKNELPTVTQAATLTPTPTPTPTPTFTGLAEIYIDTENGSSDISHDEYSGITVTTANVEQEYIIEAATATIRGRGNATWYNIYIDKKPYRIKFSEKTDLLGLGEAKSWVLLANVSDYTLMRNYLAYYLGNLLEMEYTTKYRQVNLYLNGREMGVYLLCEQTQTGKNRVDIETGDSDSENKTDVAYLIEFGGGIEEDALSFPLDMVGFVPEENWDEYHFAAVRTPDKDKITRLQETYIQDYLNETNHAVLTKDWNRIKELIDVDACVDYFLVDQVMMTGDMGWNFFLYKPQGDKLHLGPLWDFDQSSGSSTYGGSGYVGWNSGTGSEHLWLTSLIEIPEFKELVSSRWKEKYSDINSVITVLDSVTKEYHDDFIHNFDLWDILGTETFRTTEDILALDTYDENVKYLEKWLENRIRWMDNELN